MLSCSFLAIVSRCSQKHLNQSMIMIVLRILFILLVSVNIVIAFVVHCWLALMVKRCLHSLCYWLSVVLQATANVAMQWCQIVCRANVNTSRLWTTESTVLWNVFLRSCVNRPNICVEFTCLHRKTDPCSFYHRVVIRLWKAAEVFSHNTLPLSVGIHILIVFAWPHLV